jgi:large subunit ribosomal protein L4
MADAPVLGSSAKLALADEIFLAHFNEALVHNSVRAEQAARRRGTAATRTRGMVSGGGAKPWRQKGTGRARAGSSRSPVWTGGGTVFGPHPRSYTFKVNRKEHRAALRSALSLHAGRGSLLGLDAGAFDAPSTKRAAELLADVALPALVVLDASERDAALSLRNLSRVEIADADDVGVTEIVWAATLVLTDAAAKRLAERAAAPTRRNED